MCRLPSHFRPGAVVITLTAAFGIAAPEIKAQEGAPVFETTEIADGVFRFRWQSHVSMFVVGDDGILAFDPINPEAASSMADEIGRIAPSVPLKWIVYSHSDADHASGGNVLSAAFGGNVPIVATAAAVDEIAARADVNQPLPTTTFDRYLSLDMGDRMVELHFFGPSHTDNLLVGYVPDARVVFAVDFVNNDRVGYQDLPGWHFPEQNVTIRRMLGLAFETVVYGHGDVGDRASLWRQARYYDALEAAVRNAIEEGWTEDEAADRIRLPEFEGFGSYAEWFPLNVRGAYRALTGGS